MPNQPAPVADPDAGARAEQMEKAAQAEAAADDLKKAAKEGKLAPAPELKGYRSFVAPQHPNEQILISPGELNRVRDPNSPTGYKDLSRTGDLYVVFQGGVCTTKDPKVIAWCEEHSDICRDAADPITEGWAQMKGAQVKTARSEASLAPSVDVDAMLRGDYGQDTTEQSLVSVARERANAANKAEGG